MTNQKKLSTEKNTGVDTPQDVSAVKTGSSKEAQSSRVNLSGNDKDVVAFRNTNRWDTRQLVTMALMCAIGVVLSFIEFPILAAAPYLKLDASNMTAMVSGFAWGPIAGISVGVMSAVIHGIIMGDVAGSLMNVLVICFYVAPAAFIYKRMHHWKGAVLALIVGSVTALVGAILGNLIITPLYLGVALEDVIGLILPVLLPFNLIKATVNSVLTLIVYKSISNLITPKKKQIRGR